MSKQTASNINALCREKIKRIKILLLDVDGVLTDGRIILDDSGKETKSFDVKDGHGIKLILRSGIRVGFITSRRSAVVSKRAGELGIEYVYQGAINKLEAFDDIIKKNHFKEADAAFIGDDLVDIPVLKRAGFAACVSDAVDEVKEVADYIASNPGGRGAVREVCDFILKAQDKWSEVTKRYFI